MSGLQVIYVPITDLIESFDSEFNGTAYQFDNTQSLLDQVNALSVPSFVAGMWDGYNSSYASEMPENAHYYVMAFVRSSTYRIIIAVPDYNHALYIAKRRGGSWIWTKVSISEV